MKRPTVRKMTVTALDFNPSMETGIFVVGTRVFLLSEVVLLPHWYLLGHCLHEYKQHGIVEVAQLPLQCNVCPCFDFNALATDEGICVCTHKLKTHEKRDKRQKATKLHVDVTDLTGSSTDGEPSPGDKGNYISKLLLSNRSVARYDHCP